MSTATVTLSPVEYLAREREAAEKHEYIEGAMRPTAGASFLLNVIAGLIVTLLNNALAGKQRSGDPVGIARLRTSAGRRLSALARRPGVIFPFCVFVLRRLPVLT